MDDLGFKKIVLEKLSKIEDKNEDLREKLTELVVNNAIQSKDLSLIKEDLRQHKEGVIQNRGRISILETALTKFTSDTQNKIENINSYIENQKGRFKRWAQNCLHFGWILGAITAVSGAAGYIINIIYTYFIN